MRILFFFTLLLAINLLLYGKYLFNFVLNGDDLYLISGAVSSIREFFVFTGAYRPLSHLAYNLYQPFKHNFHLVYLLHLAVYTFVQFLYFYVLKRKTSILVALIMTVAIFSNPIFYYHLFTVSGDINLYIIALFLSLILLMWEKKLFFLFVFFLFGILVKETFVVLIPLVVYGVINADINRKFKFLLGILILVVLGSYLYFRIGAYQFIDVDYSFVFTWNKAKENLINFIAWLIGHPRGWQYNFYGFRNILNYILDILFLCLWLVSIIFSFLQDKKWWLLMVVCLFLSIVPFVFLNRTLVFYADLPLVILSLLLIPVLKTKFKYVILIVVLLTVWLSGYLYLQKWVDWSFVGSSNTIAKNYLNILGRLDLSDNPNICIVNHQMGIWATEDGRLIYYAYPDYKGRVVSVSEKDVENCLNEVVLINEGGEYKLMSDISW